MSTTYPDMFQPSTQLVTIFLNIAKNAHFDLCGVNSLIGCTTTEHLMQHFVTSACKLKMNGNFLVVPNEIKPLSQKVSPIGDMRPKPSRKT